MEVTSINKFDSFQKPLKDVEFIFLLSHLKKPSHFCDFNARKRERKKERELVTHTERRRDYSNMCLPFISPFLRILLFPIQAQLHTFTVIYIYRERDGEVPHSFSDPLFPLSCAVPAEGLPKIIFRRSGHMTVNRVEENV